jgi:circadian clock protein KaiC
LVEGDPGVGKTTLALQFLLEGVKQGERSLMVSLSENEEELASVAQSHNWSLTGVDIHELAPAESLVEEEQYTIFQPAEIELSETMNKVFATVEKINPKRVVFDSLSEMRLVAQNPLRYRRQIVALKQYFVGKGCTVFLLDDRTSDSKDLSLQSLVHGVIELQKFSPIFGRSRRKLQILKLRGVDFQAGYHDFNILKGGLVVYPRLTTTNHRKTFVKEQRTSGILELDQLAGGGLRQGTSVLIMGPAGTGKTTLAALYAYKCVERGDKAVIFTFDEGLDTLLDRVALMGMDLQPYIDKGLLFVQQVDPSEMSPGEFMWKVREVVERLDARVVVVDSLTGYIDAMPESEFLTIQMHEMLSYLNRQGVLTLLTLAQHGIIGAYTQTPADISYLADTVVLLRYFEFKGAIKKAISVVKQRSGLHETCIREYQMGPSGIRVGEPLADFQGVLTGVPTFTGKNNQVMEKQNDR